MSNSNPGSGQDERTGRFLPGNNLGGRKHGSKNKVSRAMYDAIAGLSDTALVQLFANIAAGDQRAIEFVLDRILPKGRLIELDGATPTDVLNALTQGAISDAEAKNLATTIARLRSVDEIDQLRAKLDELEEAMRERDP